MAHFALSQGIPRWSAIHLAAAGLITTGVLTLGLPSALANDYMSCASTLLALDLETEMVAAACALAYRPTEVSSCVTGVLSEAVLDPRDVLTACSRDRRPLEVATCVTDIHTTLPVVSSLSVLDHCHRSLLPVRYAQCVTGLAETASLATEESMVRCIAAGYRPENVAPTYIPMY
ncbi:hypothetical protein [Leptolyngbya sp. PCC 6406]|uniref:hypothetical protein n=1 Tax=Leptolyngbya sp. PCC 6406 TaxID=1173264 RepID=UPI0002ACDD77|nr:hypothetical protein [Leptolyngbya sp. PCC 6406]